MRRRLIIALCLCAGCTGVADYSLGSAALGPAGSAGGSGGPSPAGGTGGGAEPLESDGGAAPDGGLEAPPDAGVTPFDAGPCGPFATRVRTVQVNVAPAQVDTGSWGGWSNNRPVHLGPLPGGAAKVAWSASDGTVHITPLDPSLSRTGPDVIIPGVSVRGFVAHDDGSVALLVVRDVSMVLVKLHPDGTVVFEVTLVGDTPNDTTPGTRWVDGWGHEGRLLWTGSRYLAYFGHTKYWGAQGRHQGDTLLSLDAAGQSASGPGWGWGCSHSLDLRLAWDGTDAAPVCLSDCYATKAILLNDSQVLQSEPSGNCGGMSDGELGGLAALPGGGFGFTFSSREGRSTRDLGFIRLTASGPSPTVWLTATDVGEESMPNLARYGQSQLLLAYRDASGFKMATLDFDGGVIDAPVTLPSAWAARDDFATWPSGDVGWGAGGGSSLEVTQVRACSP